MMIHLKVELRQLLRRPSHLVTLIASAVTMFLLLHFGVPAQAASEAILPALMLGALMIALMGLSYTAFQEDVREGRIAHWRTAPVTLAWIVVSKWLAYVLLAALPLALSFCLALCITTPSLVSLWSYYLGVLLLCGTAVICCTLFSAAVSISFGEGQAAGTLLTLPFLFGIAIFAAEALAQPGEDRGALLLLCALTLLLIPLTCWLSALALRNSA